MNRKESIERCLQAAYELIRSKDKKALWKRIAEQCEADLGSWDGSFKDFWKSLDQAKLDIVVDSLEERAAIVARCGELPAHAPHPEVLELITSLSEDQWIACEKWSQSSVAQPPPDLFGVLPFRGESKALLRIRDEAVAQVLEWMGPMAMSATLDPSRCSVEPRNALSFFSSEHLSDGSKLTPFGLEVARCVDAIVLRGSTRAFFSWIFNASKGSQL